MKFAIIGYGGMGNFHREKAFERYNAVVSEDFIETAGIYDISPEREEFAKGLGLHVFSSAEEIWNDKSIDAVVIATPNDAHIPYVLAAAKAGKHVVVEKPAAMNLLELKEMYDAAERAGVKLSPHQNRRWDDDFVTVKNIVDNNLIGKTYLIESRVMGANGIPGAWRKSAAQGGGMMMDWGVHLIDQMLQFVKGKVVSVYCDYSYRQGEEVDDGFNLEVKFDTGLTYRIVVDTNCFVELPRWQIHADDGTLQIDNWRNFKVEGKMLRCLIRHDDKLVGVDAGNGFTKTMAKRRSETVEELPIEVVRGDKTAFYRNFVKAAREGSDTFVTRRDMERVFKVMELAKRSSETREVMKETF